MPDDRVLESDVPVKLIGETDKNLIAKAPDERRERERRNWYFYATAENEKRRE